MVQNKCSNLTCLINESMNPSKWKRNCSRKVKVLIKMDHKHMGGDLLTNFLEHKTPSYISDVF